MEHIENIRRKNQNIIESKIEKTKVKNQKWLNFKKLRSECIDKYIT